MALWLSVVVEAEILIKQETLMNRNCRKVHLHPGEHRVIRVAQLIHRISDAEPSECFGRNRISELPVVSSCRLPRPQPPPQPMDQQMLLLSVPYGGDL